MQIEGIQTGAAALMRHAHSAGIPEPLMGGDDTRVDSRCKADSHEFQRGRSMGKSSSRWVCEFQSGLPVPTMGKSSLAPRVEALLHSEGPCPLTTSAYHRPCSTS